MGIGTAEITNSTDAALQWSHNFFVMGIGTAEITNSTDAALQWSHNFFVMEIAIVQIGRNLKILPSMEP